MRSREKVRRLHGIFLDSTSTELGTITPVLIMRRKKKRLNRMKFNDFLYPPNNRGSRINHHLKSGQTDGYRE